MGQEVAGVQGQVAQGGEEDVEERYQGGDQQVVGDQEEGVVVLKELPGEVVSRWQWSQRGRRVVLRGFD